MYQRTVLKWRLSFAVEKQYNYGESETLIFSLNIFLIDYEINEKKKNAPITCKIEFKAQNDAVN